MATFFISITVYTLIGIAIFFWSIKDDHSASWALALPWIVPLIVFGWPYFLFRLLFKPIK